MGKLIGMVAMIYFGLLENSAEKNEIYEYAWG
jgi:hypothetical protein